MLNFLQANNIMDMAGLDEKFKSMIGEQLDIQHKLKPIDRRLVTLKRHIEQAEIYFKYKGKKHLTEAEQILFTAAHDYLKGVMNGKTALPVKAWKAEYAKLTAERETLNRRQLAAGTAGAAAPQGAGYGAVTDKGGGAVNIYPAAHPTVFYMPFPLAAVEFIIKAKPMFIHAVSCIFLPKYLQFHC